MFAIANAKFQPSRWQTIITLTLGFWLSSSIILDFVIMPGLYSAGMMTEPGFATAGYSIFWLFNRIELFCAALALTGVLVLQNLSTEPSRFKTWKVALALFLFGIALAYTYGLTPEMSALGLQLNLFESTTEVPAAMNQMHQGYWLLELLKLGAGGTLLGLCYPTQ
jgi:hypothetical protein